jgi:hypothetical protein
MTNPILQFPADTQDLMNAILAQAGTAQTAAALLVGSYGESGWDPFASGSGGGGAFGFTPPSYPAWLETAAPATQVAAILPAYLANLPLIPASITNPAARAEWQAIASERPLNDTTDMAEIEATNAPTTYGANFSYSVQNWDLIAEIVAFGFPPPPPPRIGDDNAMFIHVVWPGGKTGDTIKSKAGKTYAYGLVVWATPDTGVNLGNNYPNVETAYGASLTLVPDPNGTLLDEIPNHIGF